MISHDSNEIAPNCAMLAGNMMMPEPIILIVTNVVRPSRLIFLLGVVIEYSVEPVGRHDRQQ